MSGQTGTWSGNYLWSALVVDAAVHISPYVEVKGEYINTWQQTDNAGNIQPTGWWVQAGYKLAGLNLDAPVVNDVELVSRYDTANNANGSTSDRFTAGFVYYLTNTLLLEGDYEWYDNRGQNDLLMTAARCRPASLWFSFPMDSKQSKISLMRMNNKFTVFLLGVAALALFGAGVARAEDQLDAETKARIDTL